MKTCPSYGMLTGRDRLSAVSNLPALTKVTLHSDVCVAYTARHGKARRASPVRRLARYGSSTLSERQYSQTRQTKPGMGATVVGRFRKTRRHDWTQAGICHSRLRLRHGAQASQKRGRDKATSSECGPGGTVFHFDLAGICGSVLCPSGLSHPEALDAQALSFNPRPAPSSCIRQVSAVRREDGRGAAVCIAKVRQRIGLGDVQSPAQLAVEVVCQRPEVGTCCGDESGRRRGASRETPSE